MIKRRVRRQGQITWEPFKWYATVESCVNGLGQQMVRDSKAEKIVDAIRDVEHVCSVLSAALSPQFEIKPGPYSDRYRSYSHAHRQPPNATHSEKNSVTVQLCCRNW